MLTLAFYTTPSHLPKVSAVSPSVSAGTVKPRVLGPMNLPYMPFFCGLSSVSSERRAGKNAESEELWGTQRVSREAVGYAGLELRRAVWAGDGFGHRGSSCSQGA